MNPGESWTVPISPDRFAGQVVAVTGAASGIGRATAIRFAREGAKAALIDRDRDGAESIAKEITSHNGIARAYRTPLSRSLRSAMGRCLPSRPHFRVAQQRR